MTDRAIKFRAWDKKEHKMKYVLQLEWHMDTPDKMIAIHTYPIGIYMHNHPNSKRINDLVLQQFTGLKDKNGKEIYEGDVVNCWDDGFTEMGRSKITGIVEYYDNAFMLKSDNIFTQYWTSAEQIEVVGNIYETHLNLEFDLSNTSYDDSEPF